jgi:3',5'-cyclic AMP phosphodiesterase CpdA
MSYSPTLLLNQFFEHKKMVSLANKAGIGLPLEQSSLSKEKFDSLLKVYVYSLLKKIPLRELDNFLINSIVELRDLIQKLKNQAERVNTVFVPLAAVATSHAVDSKKMYSERLSLQLSHYKKALVDTLFDTQIPILDWFCLAIRCAFNSRHFVEHNTTSNVRRLGFSDQINPFSEKKQSTTATLGENAKILADRFCEWLNKFFEDNRSTLTASEAFYQLWLMSYHVNYFGAIASKTLLDYIAPSGLLGHFSTDLPRIMTENVVNQKYVTCGPLIIDYDASFLCNTSVFNASVIGCHGVSTSVKKAFQRPDGAWETIANAVSKQNGQQLLSLGDAAYEYGATSFLQIDAELAAYRKLNQWFCWGNHEYGLCSGGPKHRASVVPELANLYEKDNQSLCGFQRGLLFWARSYLPEDASRIQNEEINVKDMSNFHAPYRYYAVAFKSANTLMIVLDSNLFAFDVPQQKWFCELLLNPAYINYKKLLVMHHPFIDPGKRGDRDKAEDLELKRYHHFIEKWFEGIQLINLDPRKPQMWIHAQKTTVDYSLKACPTVGCFIANFLANNTLCSLLNNMVVLSAHFHGHMEYEVTLDGKATVRQIILGAGGAQLEKAKSLVRNTALATFHGIALKDPEKWAHFRITNFKLTAHGGMNTFDYANLVITSKQQNFKVKLIKGPQDPGALPVITRDPAQRVYDLTR